MTKIDTVQPINRVINIGDRNKEPQVPQNTIKVEDEVSDAISDAVERALKDTEGLSEVSTQRLVDIIEETSKTTPESQEALYNRIYGNKKTD